MRILVTGATGYIGGRLAPRLLGTGHQVRCMTRDPARLAEVSWAHHPDVEVVRADALDPAALRRALDGVDTAYYLIHSIDSGGDFSSVDRAAARAFADAARNAGVGRLVYLGGLSPASGAGVSEHLASRQEVARVLLDSGVPTVVLRAAVIIGSGSASFEMLRHLTERLPVMVTPRWVRTRIQPIAVRDVLYYLVGCLDLPAGTHRSFDIGGPDILTYAEMMQRFAAVEGLRRRVIIPVPVLSPGLSSHWVGLVTPVPRAIARPLVRSLRTEVVAAEHDIASWVPDPPDGLVPFDTSVAYALARVRDRAVETRWSTAVWPGSPITTPFPEVLARLCGDPGTSRPAPPGEPVVTDPVWAGSSLYTDERSRAVDAPAGRLWAVIEGIGGENGWYSWPLAWSARGWLDILAGGVGHHRGRRDPHRLRTGEAIDLWRVEELVPGRLLRLRAEMKLPGQAWLELRVDPDGSEPGGTEPGGGGAEGGSPESGAGGRRRVVYRQRALFLPHGLPGHLYWKAVSPFHSVVFGGMLRTIVRHAESGAAPTGSPERPHEAPHPHGTSHPHETSTALPQG
ncbi:NAD(P)-dependent oxidoreductase [Parafrankia colletiae]|uniref:NAD(P)-dependent oxidoreductase n=1 Tax=Parafrankia colletiae TaxID=573497 RepID=A0A1S1QTM4_9ACTN|nr:SDR family oxidoreductase [Parafrankia colletiae]MCK9904111.1 SDR family oxidoreductase [Frankia sp. Cpl3]OHV36909.1 NAD(P)-dependent oxidoreductase [Parafrankia colletiae]